jgi:death on curing protein
MQFIWLTREQVAAFHLRQLAEHGGSPGVRDMGLLDSVLQRPKDKVNYGQPDISELAAAYAYCIARNHPFIDGNKRTALVTSFTFLYLNGYKVTTSQAENLKPFLALASGTLPEVELAVWFRQNLRTMR